MANEKKIKNNGHKYVDLDLPSGTLWATMNVGASKPSECGLYFQWGDAKGYSATQVGKDKEFNWKDYKWYLSGNYATDDIPFKFKKYTTPGDKLELEDDSVHVNMGGSWHMPTPDQIQELIDNTTSEWTKQNDVNGTLFTSKKDASKSVFIPASGYAANGFTIGVGRYGFIWTNMLNSKHNDSGQEFGYISFSTYLYTYLSRSCGLSVRGVIG